MKIKNDYIKIIQGEKELTLKNYIYDDYLKLFSISQIYDIIDSPIAELVNTKNEQKTLDMVYIKFDEPLENYKNATKTEFDIYFDANNINKTTTQNSAEIYYQYKLDNIENYIGRKITALGFTNVQSEILACIDVSNYNLRINQTEKFVILRKDIFSSDAECVGYDYPIHLVPQQNFRTYWINYTSENPQKIDYKEPLAILYSVGYGTQKGIMDIENVLQPQGVETILNVHVISPLEYGVTLKIDSSPKQYLGTNKFLSNSKYPIQESVSREQFLTSYNHPQSNKYPLKGSYRYLMMKYRLFYIEYRDGVYQTILLNKYYTMNIPINKTTGIFELREIIERESIIPQPKNYLITEDNNIIITEDGEYIIKEGGN